MYEDCGIKLIEYLKNVHHDQIKLIKIFLEEIMHSTILYEYKNSELTFKTCVTKCCFIPFDIAVYHAYIAVAFPS